MIYPNEPMFTTKPFECMSQRDYIAVMAMQGILANASLGIELDSDEIARVAYEHTESLIEASKQK
jgi:hypothetical protein